MSTATYKAIHRLDEGGTVVRIDPGADLDELLLDIILFDEILDTVQTWAIGGEIIEPVTSLHSHEAEALVGWFRMNPCTCGEHGWHLAHLGDERPEGSAGRGAWFGVWFQEP